MSFTAHSTKTPDEIFNEFHVKPETGLYPIDVEKRLKQNGYNEFNTRQILWYEILIRQFKSTFVYMLIGAAFLALWLGEYIDAGMIFLFVLINSGLGFYQEYQSEKTLDLLKKYITHKAIVIRGGKEILLPSRELVHGDILVIETGDIIGADIRIVKENNLVIDESLLTGESVPINKSSKELAADPKAIHEAKNIAFMGTTVISGKGFGVVLATGKETEMGKIAKLTAETHRQSGFEKQINRFSQFILYLILITLVLVFLAHLFIKQNFSDIPNLLIFSIALAVGVIPEALPLVTTFALSHGARRLAHKKVVVKRLSSIEDLGSIEVLCSDKTGTLTENKLRVVELSPGSSDETIFFGALAGSNILLSKKTSNNSFDLALSEKLTIQEKSHLKTFEIIKDLPFDPVRRRNSVVVKNTDQRLLIVRGAPESILPYITNINMEKAQNIAKWIVSQGISGCRVLVVAVRDISKIENVLQEGADYSYTEEETELTLVGIVAFHDPIKKSTKEAVNKAQKLGVSLKILTGDSKEVAGAVAYEVGIIDNPGDVITGDELDYLESDKQFEAINHHNVFARISPDQKYKIIQILQQKYQVGFLGEGINDAPALKAADVALVVEGASDIAQEASDIVLLRQNLEVIIDGIEEGRKTFVNTVKYIKTTLTSNFGNFYAVATSSLLIPFLPILPIQILLLNLLSDFPMISIATDEVEPDELKNPKSYEIKEIILVATVLGLISTLFDFIFFGLFYRQGQATLQTNWFIGSLLTEIVLIFSVRTKRLFFKAKTFPSTTLIILGAVGIFSGILLTYSPLGATLFRFKAPSIYELSTVIFVVLIYFVFTELVKNIYYRFLYSHRARVK